MSGKIPAPGPVAMPPSHGPVPQASDRYLIRLGDNLSEIAKKFLGDPDRWPEIYRLNRDLLRSPELLIPGTILRLPAEATVARPTTPLPSRDVLVDRPYIRAPRTPEATLFQQLASQADKVTADTVSRQAARGIMVAPDLDAAEAEVVDLTIQNADRSFDRPYLYQVLAAYGIDEAWMRAQAGREGVPLELVERMVWQESVKLAKARAGYRATPADVAQLARNIGSPAGARGLFQLMPGTAREMGVSNRADPRQNLVGGMKYLRDQLETFRGNVRKAVAAYNAGPGAVKSGRANHFRETRAYLKNILGTNAQVISV